MPNSIRNILKSLVYKGHMTQEQMDKIVRNLKSKDSVYVVRCKDCKHRDPEDKKCDWGMISGGNCQGETTGTVQTEKGKTMKLDLIMRVEGTKDSTIITDYAPVVLCKDCIHFAQTPDEWGDNWCRLREHDTGENDYCSSAKRKETDNA